MEYLEIELLRERMKQMGMHLLFFFCNNQYVQSDKPIAAYLRTERWYIQKGQTTRFTNL